MAEEERAEIFLDGVEFRDAEEFPEESSSPKILILNAAECRQCFPMSAAIVTQARAFHSFQNGTTLTPDRTITKMPNNPEAMTLFKPAMTSENIGIKIVSVRPDNPSNNLPQITGCIILFDGLNGLPLCYMDAQFVTGRRTAAGSGLATALFSSADAKILTVFGAGVQGEEHIRAVLCVRKIKQVFIWNRTLSRAEKLAEKFSKIFPDVMFNAIVNDEELETSVRSSDIICTCTAANGALFPSGWIKNGAHINAVGSFTPSMIELDSDLVKSSAVILDSKKALETGEFDFENREQSVVGNLGEFVFHSQNLDSRNDSKISELKSLVAKTTIFKSVGLAAQDLHAAVSIFQHAAANSIGSYLG